MCQGQESQGQESHQRSHVMSALPGDITIQELRR